jgi:hypothetical protein
MKSKNALLKTRGELTRKLLRFREMLPGSFIERQLTCGKQNCVCKTEGKKHTAWQITYRLQNKNTTKMVPRHKVEEVRKNILLQKNFNQIVKQIQEINIKLLMMELGERKPRS